MRTLEEILASKGVQTTPQPKQQTTTRQPVQQAPTNRIVQQTETPRGKIYSGGTMSDILDTLSIPGSAVASFARGAIKAGKSGNNIITGGFSNIPSGVQNRTSFIDVADEAGVKNKYLKAGLGFAGDMLLDPLNYIGVGTAAKLLNKTTAGKKIVKGVEGLTSAKTLLPKLGGVGDWIGKKFVYRYGQTDDYVKAAENLTNKIAKGEQKAIDIGQSLKYAPDNMTIGNKTYKKGQELSTAAQQRLNQILRGGISNNETLKGITDPAKQALSDSWEAMVKSGVVEDSATRFKGEYVPNMYRSILGGDPTILKAGGRKINESRLIRRKDLQALGEKYLERFPNLNKYTDKVSANTLENMGTKFQKELGLIKEPAFPVAKGIAQENKNAALGEFFQYLNKNVAKDVAEPGLKQLPTADNLKDLAGKFVPDYVYDELVGPGGIMTSKNAFEKFMTRYWKPAKTVLNPAQQARNAVSNQILNYMVGGNKAVRQLPSAIKQFKTKGNFYKEAVDAGIIGKGFADQEILGLLDNLDSGGTVAAKVGNKAASAWDRVVQWAGNNQSAVEDISKLQQFMTWRKQGKSIEEAAKMAEKALFDYGKITPFERKLRQTAIPFYTFARKSVPLVAETAVKNPTRLTAFKKGEAAIESLSQEREGERKLLPSYLRGQVRLPTPKSETGKKLLGDKPYLSTKYTYPWGNIFDESALPFGLNIPAIDVVSKVGAGYDPYYKAQLTESPRKSDQIKARAGAAARTILPAFPFNTLFRKYPQAGGLPDFVKSKTDAASIAGDITGIKVNNLDIGKTMQSRDYEIKDITNKYEKMIEKAAQRGDGKEVEKLQRDMVKDIQKLVNP